MSKKDPQDQCFDRAHLIVRGHSENITLIQDNTANAAPFLYKVFVILMFLMTAAPTVKVQPSDVRSVMLPQSPFKSRCEDILTQPR